MTLGILNHNTGPMAGTFVNVGPFKDGKYLVQILDGEKVTNVGQCFPNQLLIMVPDEESEEVPEKV